MRPEPQRQTELQAAALAGEIVDWLRERNGGELAEAFDAMRVKDARTLRHELEEFLVWGRRPRHWVDR